MNEDNKRNTYPELYTQKETTKKLVCSYVKLIEAEKRCHRKVGYKNSVSRFDLNLLARIYELRKELLTDTYSTGHGQVFEIFEPKYRLVTSTKFKDRIPQASFVLNYMYPNIIRYHSVCNCACVKNKGIEYARNRLKALLRRSELTEYCLKVDFKDYFASIDHQLLFVEIDKFLNDSWAKLYFQDVVNCNKQKVGIGLGSEINQLCGVSFLNKLDHELENYKYVRYMDDLIAIGTKQICVDILNTIKLEARRLRLEISKHKTYIQSVSKPIKFLGFTFLLHETKKITLKRIRQKLRNERRKLRHMQRKGVPISRVLEHYQSVRAYMKKGTRSGVVKLDRYFKQLFKGELQQC